MTVARLAIGASAKNENMLWATRFFAPDPFVLLYHGGRRIIAVSRLEYGRAKKESRADEVILADDLPPVGGARPRTEAAQALSLLRMFGVRSVLVEESFPAAAYRWLAAEKIRVSFADPLFPERAVKSADEIADITRAQRAMEEAFGRLLPMIADATIRRGELWAGGERLTSEMLRSAFDTELMRQDCVCDATIVASGEDAADPHCAGSGPIRAHTPIVLDMFPRSRRFWYWSDMSRTIAKGRRSADARKMYRAVLDAQQMSVEMVRPGIRYSDINAAAAASLRRRGFRTGSRGGKQYGFFHSVGHGVGLEIHEHPFARGDAVLEAGNVITIEPGLYYPGIGGVRIEDTIVVTENGHENLARVPKDLIELP